MILRSSMYILLYFRCNTYDNLPSTCTLIPDPNDPTCCQVPQCTTPTPGPNQPVTVKGQPGSFTGFGITETLPPTPPTTFNPFLPTQQPTPAPQPSTPRPDGEIICLLMDTRGYLKKFATQLLDPSTEQRI